MRYVSDLNIGKSIIHVVDPMTDEPVLSSDFMNLSVSEIEFISKHIVKGLNDDENFRCRAVSKDRETYQRILRILTDRECLVEESRHISNELFQISKKYDGVLAGDLLFSMFFYEGQECLAILKLDYQETYAHEVNFDEGNLSVSLVTQETGLPSAGQRLKKSAYFRKIGDDELEIFAINKYLKSEADELKNYFTFEFLGIEIVDDPTSMTRRFKSTFETWARKNLKDDIEKASEFRDRIDNTLLNSGSVDVQEIAIEVFKGDVQLQNELLDEAGKKGFSPSETFSVDKTWVEKKMKSKQIQTDTGLVIKGEFDLFSDDNKFQMVRNGDGTVDYIIKGVRNVKER